MIGIPLTIGDHFDGELTPEDCERLGVKEWCLSDEAIAEIEKIEAAITR